MHFVKPGFRTLTIPVTLTSGVARNIIRALQESSDD